MNILCFSQLICASKKYARSMFICIYITILSMLCRQLCSFYSQFNSSKFINIDWNYIIEVGARKKMVSNPCQKIISKLEVLKNSYKPMFTIMNQASFEQAITYCPSIIHLPLHKLYIYDTRLSSLYLKANNFESPSVHAVAFPLYSNKDPVPFKLPKLRPKRRRLHYSIGTKSHSTCRMKLSKFYNQPVTSKAKWQQSIAEAEFVLMCGGTFPVTFMLYETILLGSIPVIIIPTTTRLTDSHKHMRYTTPTDLYGNMPFSDDGVDWKKFSIVALEKHTNFTELTHRIKSMDKKTVGKMKQYLASIRHRFLPSNAWKYANSRTPSTFINSRVP